MQINGSVSVQILARCPTCSEQMDLRADNLVECLECGHILPIHAAGTRPVYC